MSRDGASHSAAGDPGRHWAASQTRAGDPLSIGKEDQP